jgi:hypothetical protein
MEIVTAGGVFLALLWNVLNEIRLREHSKALQANEAHLRVKAELKLRLHQQAWDLLRATQDAAFKAFDSIRNYQVAAIAIQGGAKGTLMWGAEYQAAMLAVQNFSGLAHVSPPDRQGLRDAASAFSKAFNMVNSSALGGRRADAQHDELMKTVTDALATAALATREWNEELWRHQTIDELAPGPQ